jgi:hypothetical protein
MHAAFKVCPSSWDEKTDCRADRVAYRRQLQKGRPLARQHRVPTHGRLLAGVGHCTFVSLPREHTMLETVAVVLLILWALGMVSAYTLGGFIHVLLVIAVVMILLRLIRGRGL